MQRKRHRPEQVIRKLRDTDRMLSEGKDIAAVCQALEVCEATFHRWRNQHGGMKANEAKRLKELEIENRRLKKAVANLTLDKQSRRVRLGRTFFLHSPAPKFTWA